VKLSGGKPTTRFDVKALCGKIYMCTGQTGISASHRGTCNSISANRWRETGREDSKKRIDTATLCKRTKHSVVREGVEHQTQAFGS
jgi:hypothetical protein